MDSPLVAMRPVPRPFCVCDGEPMARLGRLGGRDLVRRLAGRRLNRVSEQIRSRGALTVAAARLLPVAPFTVVNLVAGASRIGVRDFALGTLLGTAPGIVAIALLQSRAEAALSNPGPGTVGVLVAIAGGVVGMFAALRRLLKRGRSR